MSVSVTVTVIVTVTVEIETVCYVSVDLVGEVKTLCLMREFSLVPLIGLEQVVHQ